MDGQCRSGQLQSRNSDFLRWGHSRAAIGEIAPNRSVRVDKPQIGCSFEASGKCCYSMRSIDLDPNSAVSRHLSILMSWLNESSSNHSCHLTRCSALSGSSQPLFSRPRSWISILPRIVNDVTKPKGSKTELTAPSIPLLVIGRRGCFMWWVKA